MIRLGISLIQFKPEYAGGLNSFTLGLLKSLKKKCFLNIYTNKRSYYFLKNIFPNSNIIIYSKSNFFYLTIQLFSILFKSEKLFEFSENYYYKNLKKEIEDNCDIFYCPLSYLKPNNLNIPKVTSIHDLQHQHYPHYFNYLQIKYREFMYNLTIDKSTKIQASTNFIRKDIKKIYPTINKNKIVVINEGVSNEFKSCSYNLKKNSFIFFPAQLWKHKNHITVLKALKFIKDKHNINIKLIMVGSKFSGYKEILYFINKNKHLDLEYLGKVSFKKILKLYKNCRFLISPALYESSSIPILEASKVGRPIIASRSKSNQEIGKKFRVNFFNTNDYKDLAKLIFQLWNNKKLLINQIKKNKIIIKKYEWDNISNEYFKLFKNLAYKK